jgi:hypothetical protein
MFTNLEEKRRINETLEATGPTLTEEERERQCAPVTPSSPPPLLHARSTILERHLGVFEVQVASASVQILLASVLRSSVDSHLQSGLALRRIWNSAART